MSFFCFFIFIFLIDKEDKMEEERQYSHLIVKKVTWLIMVVYVANLNVKYDMRIKYHI